MHPQLTKLNPIYVPKGWGSESILVNNDEYCGKILKFNAGAKFSMHAHIKKMETFYVLSGRIEVTGIYTEDSSRYISCLGKGDILHIPRFCFHQITAIEKSEIIEFSTHHEDSDSVRIEKGDSQK